MVGHWGSSAGSYLADPTSPIQSHCASVVLTSTLRVNTCLGSMCVTAPKWVPIHSGITEHVWKDQRMGYVSEYTKTSMEIPLPRPSNLFWGCADYIWCTDDHLTLWIKTVGKQLSSCCTPRQDGLGICPKIRRLWVQILPGTKLRLWQMGRSNSVSRENHSYCQYVECPCKSPSLTCVPTPHSTSHYFLLTFH